MKNILEFLFGSGVIIVLINIIIQNREIYINNINVKRNENNNALRKVISKIVAHCILNKKGKVNTETIDKAIKLEYEFYQSIAMARMFLSIHPERIGNAGHDILDNKLKEIQDMENITDDVVEETLFLARQILDFEWNRVKNEAKGEM